MIKYHSTKKPKKILLWKKGLKHNYIFLMMPWFFFKLLCLFIKNGRKELIEVNILRCLKTVDYLVLLEIIYNLEVPYIFYSKKKRKGRRSFIYYNTLVFTKNIYFCQIAVKTFFCFLLKSNKSLKNTFNSDLFINFIYQYYKEKGKSILLHLSNYKQTILKLRSIRHFRWS